MTKKIAEIPEDLKKAYTEDTSGIARGLNLEEKYGMHEVVREGD